jgi:hypothetical protein
MPMVDLSANSMNPVGAVRTFEERLAENSRWALSEGSLFFAGEGAVQGALHRIARRLNELGIPYAVVGGMALFQHGYRRFTEDVDILVTRDGLKAIHAELDGRGYVRPFEKSKNLRDTESGVKIEFLLAGDYPGDGKPKDVRFPDPQSVFIDRDGVKYVTLATLVDLKLASGLTGADRIKDLADVQELIKLLQLPDAFGAGLNESVRGKYHELWRAVHVLPRRYIKLWQPDLMPVEEAERQLAAMQADGITIDPDRTDSSGRASYLVTTDPEAAKKYGLQDESEYWADEDDL